MTPQQNLGSKRAMVIGLGLTGLSCARYLLANGYSVAVTDSRENPPCLAQLREELPDVAVFVGGFSEAALSNADIVLVSPGVSLNESFVKRVRASGVEMCGDIELFARVVTRPVIAITGSNGKSTVATLLARMAEADGRSVGLGGNVGTPALDLLAETPRDIYVLELSSFQLESTRSLRPTAATILNISADHIDWHGSLDNYAKAKARIFAHASVCVFNRDDALTAAQARGLANAISFGLGEPTSEVDFGIREQNGPWLCRGTENLLPVSELRLQGRHNWSNALACLALGFAAGFKKQAMLDALRRFSGLPHRMAWVAERNDVLYINDSKGTNVGATMAAIQGAGRPIVLIAGGDGKSADFAELADSMQGKVKHLVLIGKDAQRIAAAVGERISHEFAADMNSAVRLAAAKAVAGDMVLLSPACASLDMYANYAARGEAFVQAVEALK